MNADQFADLLSAYLVCISPINADYFLKVRKSVSEGLLAEGIFVGHLISGDCPMLDKFSFLHIMMKQLQNDRLVKRTTPGLLEHFVDCILYKN